MLEELDTKIPLEIYKNVQLESFNLKSSYRKLNRNIGFAKIWVKKETAFTYVLVKP